MAVNGRPQRHGPRGPGDALNAVAQVRGEWKGEYFGIAGPAWQHASGLRVPLVLARLEMDEARFLRHSGQRKRALTRLRSAAARLAALEARPYAQLCDQELARCQAQPRPGQTPRELGLTTAEFAVARAVGRGLTNKETADELYLSVKTIEFHLSHIYMKLDIRSRRELARLLEDPEQGSLSAADEGAPPPTRSP